MLARERLYLQDNLIKQKAINIDDNLYEGVKRLSLEVYDANISDIINVAIEEYKEPKFYGRKELDTVTYRNIRLRKDNIDKLDAFSKNTGISFTRLVNSAIKEFLDN